MSVPLYGWSGSSGEDHSPSKPARFGASEKCVCGVLLTNRKGKSCPNCLLGTCDKCAPLTMWSSSSGTQRRVCETCFYDDTPSVPEAVPRKPEAGPALVLTPPPAISMPPVRRLDFDEFEHLETQPPPEGSSLSKGMYFRGGKKYFGKARLSEDHRVSLAAVLTEISACDIYKYFGCRSPQLIPSIQYWRGVERGVLEKHGVKMLYGPHLMTEWLDNFTQFDPTSFTEQLRDGGEAWTIEVKEAVPGEEGCHSRAVPVSGIGRVLAVGLFLNDIDVLQARGENVGYILIRNETGVPTQALAVKVDMEQAFTNVTPLQPQAPTALAENVGGPPVVKEGAQVEGDSELEFWAKQEASRHIRYCSGKAVHFDALPDSVKREFLVTVREIITKPPGTIRLLLDREGLEDLYQGKTVLEERYHFLLSRQALLRAVYGDLVDQVAQYEIAPEDVVQRLKELYSHMVVRDPVTEGHVSLASRVVNLSLLVDESGGRGTRSDPLARVNVVPTGGTGSSLHDDRLKRVDIAMGDMIARCPVGPRKLIGLVGGAGSGKTTCCQSIAMRWARGEMYQEFSLVFYVPLRHLTADRYPATREHGAVDVAIQECVQEEVTGKRREQMSALIASAESRVLWILDGYDEVVGNVPPSVAGALKEMVSQPTVILAGRPHAMGTISFSLMVEAAGFKDADIVEFVRRFVKERTSAPEPITVSEPAFRVGDSAVGSAEEKEAGDPTSPCGPDPSRGPPSRSVSRGRRSRSAVDTTPRAKTGQSSELTTTDALLASIQSRSVLWKLAHVPINLLLMCHVLSDPAQSEGLEVTLTQLYVHVEELMMKQYSHRLRRKEAVPLSDDTTAKLLRCLASLAFEALRDVRAIIPGALVTSELVKVGLAGSGEVALVDCGVLVKVSDGAAAGGQPEYQFLHLTLQEYFAGKYLVEWFVTDGPDAMAWLRQHKHRPQLEVMLWFAAGLFLDNGPSTSSERIVALKAFLCVLHSHPRDLGRQQETRCWLRVYEEGQFGWLAYHSQGVERFVRDLTDWVLSSVMGVLACSYSPEEFVWSSALKDCPSFCSQFLVSNASFAAALKASLSSTVEAEVRVGVDVATALGSCLFEFDWLYEVLGDLLMRPHESVREVAFGFARTLGSRILKNKELFDQLTSESSPGLFGVVVEMAAGLVDVGDTLLPWLLSALREDGKMRPRAHAVLLRLGRGLLRVPALLDWFGACLSGTKDEVGMALQILPSLGPDLLDVPAWQDAPSATAQSISQCLEATLVSSDSYFEFSGVVSWLKTLGPRVLEVTWAMGWAHGVLFCSTPEPRFSGRARAGSDSADSAREAASHSGHASGAESAGRGWQSDSKEFDAGDARGPVVPSASRSSLRDAAVAVLLTCGARLLDIDWVPAWLEVALASLSDGVIAGGALRVVACLGVGLLQDHMHPVLLLTVQAAQCGIGAVHAAAWHVLSALGPAVIRVPNVAALALAELQSPGTPVEAEAADVLSALRESTLCSHPKVVTALVDLCKARDSPRIAELAGLLLSLSEVERVLSARLAKGHTAFVAGALRASPVLASSPELCRLLEQLAETSKCQLEVAGVLVSMGRSILRFRWLLSFVSGLVFSEDLQHRCAAVEVLGGIGSGVFVRPAFHRLFLQLLNTKSYAVQRSVLQVLRRAGVAWLGEPALVNFVKAVLRGQNAALARAVVGCMAQLKDNSVLVSSECYDPFFLKVANKFCVIVAEAELGGVWCVTPNGQVPLRATTYALATRVLEPCAESIMPRINPEPAVLQWLVEEFRASGEREPPVQDMVDELREVMRPVVSRPDCCKKAAEVLVELSCRYERNLPALTLLLGGLLRLMGEFLEAHVLQEAACDALATLFARHSGPIREVLMSPSLNLLGCLYAAMSNCATYPGVQLRALRVMVVLVADPAVFQVVVASGGLKHVQAVRDRLLSGSAPPSAVLEMRHAYGNFFLALSPREVCAPHVAAAAPNIIADMCAADATAQILDAGLRTLTNLSAFVDLQRQTDPIVFACQEPILKRFESPPPPAVFQQALWQAAADIMQKQGVKIESLDLLGRILDAHQSCSPVLALYLVALGVYCTTAERSEIKDLLSGGRLAHVFASIGKHTHDQIQALLIALLQIIQHGDVDSGVHTLLAGKLTKEADVKLMSVAAVVVMGMCSHSLTVWEVEYIVERLPTDRDKVGPLGWRHLFQLILASTKIDAGTPCSTVALRNTVDYLRIAHFDDLELVTVAARALARLCENPSNREWLVGSHALQWMCGAARTCREEVLVQQWVLAALVHLSLVCAGVDNVSTNFIDPVCKAMEKHIGSEAVQAHGCDVLRNLSTVAPSQNPEIVRSGGVTRVVAAMSVYADHGGIQAAGCALLGTLAKQAAEHFQPVLWKPVRAGVARNREIVVVGGAGYGEIMGAGEDGEGPGESLREGVAGESFRVSGEGEGLRLRRRVSGTGGGVGACAVGEDEHVEVGGDDAEVGKDDEDVGMGAAESRRGGVRDGEGEAQRVKPTAVSAVLGAMDQFAAGNSGVGEVTVALHTLSAYNIAVEEWKGFVDVNGLARLWTALDRFPDDEEVAVSVLSLCAHVAENEDCRAGVVGGLARIVGAMQRFPANKDILSVGITILYLVSKSEVFAAVEGVNGLTVLCRALSSHTGDTQPWKHACWALFHLARSDRLRQKMVQNQELKARLMKLRSWPESVGQLASTVYMYLWP